MTVNVELLEQTMQHIKDHPEQHAQETWCGTAQCFGGWAANFAGYETTMCDGLLMHCTKSGNLVVTVDAARAELGLSEGESAVLFHSGNTIPMLELMVKDLVNGDALRDATEYRWETHA